MKNNIFHSNEETCLLGPAAQNPPQSDQEDLRWKKNSRARREQLKLMLCKQVLTPKFVFGLNPVYLAPSNTFILKSGPECPRGCGDPADAADHILGRHNVKTCSELCDALVQVLRRQSGDLSSLQLSLDIVSKVSNLVLASFDRQLEGFIDSISKVDRGMFIHWPLIQRYSDQRDECDPFEACPVSVSSSALESSASRRKRLKRDPNDQQLLTGGGIGGALDQFNFCGLRTSETDLNHQNESVFDPFKTKERQERQERASFNYDTERVRRIESSQNQANHLILETAFMNSTETNYTNKNKNNNNHQINGFQNTTREEREESQRELFLRSSSSKPKISEGEVPAESNPFKSILHPYSSNPGSLSNQNHLHQGFRPVNQHPASTRIEDEGHSEKENIINPNHPKIIQPGGYLRKRELPTKSLVLRILEGEIAMQGRSKQTKAKVASILSKRAGLIEEVNKKIIKRLRKLDGDSRIELLEQVTKYQIDMNSVFSGRKSWVGIAQKNPLLRPNVPVVRSLGDQGSFRNRGNRENRISLFGPGFD